ncbi:MAG: hypothetical protein M1812_001436 [Candelaria pacifica]|nr:MAG: hypothetical protein M1812_001436 [Candelaria pacifica]
MPFRFSFLCDLLSNLEHHITRDPPHLPARVKELCRETIIQWFRNHRNRIDGTDTDDVALLSALFPERRTDRVYNLREASLSKVFARILGLSTSRVQELESWKQKGRGDLAECVERILEKTPNAKQDEAHQVTVEEVDQALAGTAARCRFSGPHVRANATTDAADTLEKLLGSILRRLPSRDAKWLTRMILKDYTPVVLPEGLSFKSFHFLLPDILNMHSSFDAAISVLRGPVIGGWFSWPDKSVQGALRESAAKHLVPKLGVKVGRAAFLKARSIKHCLQMVGTRRMSLEKKYDGEYCQIHVDLANEENWIQIFSKSGKDSTIDRKAIHNTIHKCLDIGKKTCKIIGKCILEGELVVFSDKDNKILEFHKLRKHLPRSGTYLGTEHDSQPHEFEHLMIIFYDILLIDNDNILGKSHSDRRQRMKQVVTRIPGRAEFAMREEIDFSRPSGAERLRHFFAHGVTHRWEGFVLKSCVDPYFSFGKDSNEDYAGYWIKLKKDYIQGLGDTADFAVIGASYNAKEAQKFGLSNLSWTTFHIGCMENKQEVVRSGAKPMFRVVYAPNQSINKHDLKALNQLGQFQAMKHGCEAAKEAFGIRAESHAHCVMDVVFREPFVFEISGFGFDKNPDTAYFVPRFPRVNKIHWDRSFKDTVCFQELQAMAEEARAAPVEEQASQEEAEWVEKLKRSDLTSAERKALTQTLTLPPFDSSQTSNATKRRSPQRNSGNAPRPPLVRIDTSELFGHASRSTTPAAGARPLAVASLMTPPTSSAPEVGGDSPLSLDSSRPLSVPSKVPSKRKAADALGLTSMTRLAKKPNLNKISGSPPSHAHLLPQRVVMPAITTSFKPSTMPLGDVTNTSPTCVRRASVVIMEDTSKVGNNTLSPTKEERTTTHASRLLPGAPPPKYPGEEAQTNLENRTVSNRGSNPDNLNPNDDNQLSSKTSSSATSSHESSSNTQHPNVTVNDRIQTPFNALHAGSARCCSGAHECALSNVTILLSPDIAQMPYITEDLLPLHSAPSTTNLQLWNRHHNPIPSHQPKQKIVLVESRRADSTASLILEVLSLDLNEKILFYDWRLLEELGDLEKRGVGKGSGEWIKRFYTACVEGFQVRGGERRMVGKEGLGDGRWRF